MRDPTASFVLIRALRQCAIECKDLYPVASRAALQCLCLDTYFVGSDNTSDLAELHRQLVAMLNKSGFQLSHSRSNSSQMDNQPIQQSTSYATIGPRAGLLGFAWDPNTDHIKLKLKYEPEAMSASPTKGDIISAISKNHDPSGLFGPIMMIGKLIIQDIWRIPTLGWNEPAPLHLVQRWQTFDNNVRLTTSIHVPRWLGFTQRDQIECHIFSGASKAAYAAVAYLRIIGEDNKICVNAITSKSRVPPIKSHSMPRLELLGSLCGAKLAEYIRNVYNLTYFPIYCWVSSSIVIHWLNDLT